MRFERRFLPGLLVLTLACFGCEESGELAEDQKPIIGLLELPISHRAGGAEPADPARIEIGISEVRVDGATALTLDHGKVAPADQQGDLLPKVAEKLSGKRALSISVHAATPYATLARVISTGLSKGATELGFKVRKPGSNSEAGWLVLKSNRMVESAEDGAFDEGELLPWETFTSVWEGALEACKETARGDCGYKPIAKAEGGKLDLMLRSRGAGLALRFRQTGVDAQAEAEKKPKPAPVKMLDGVAPPPAAEEEAEEPSSEHVFTLRADQATVSPSPISGIVKTVCSSQTCPTIVDAEGPSMSGRVISLIGAAFPDGTPEPKVAWVKAPK